MKTTPVKSTNVRAVGYDESKRELRVEFHNGQSYDYVGVPPEKHQALMAADSKGKYLNREIKPAFIQRKIGLPPQQDEASTPESRPRPVVHAVGHAVSAENMDDALGEAVKRYQERPEKPGR